MYELEWKKDPKNALYIARHKNLTFHLWSVDKGFSLRVHTLGETSSHFVSFFPTEIEGDPQKWLASGKKLYDRPNAHKHALHYLCCAAEDDLRAKGILAT